MATLKPDWSMPEAPVAGAVPGYYNDSNEIWLHWVEGGSDEFLPVEIDGFDSTIAWPFVEEKIKHTDLEVLGFVNTDP